MTRARTDEGPAVEHHGERPLRGGVRPAPWRGAQHRRSPYEWPDRWMIAALFLLIGVGALALELGVLRS